jgi:hypothetical protein
VACGDQDWQYACAIERHQNSDGLRDGANPHRAIGRFCRVNAPPRASRSCLAYQRALEFSCVMFCVTTRRANQAHLPFLTPCPAPPRKIFRFSEYPNHPYIIAIPSPTKGALRTSRTLGRDAVDAEAPLTNGADRGRRSRVVPTPRRWCQIGGVSLSTTVANKPGTPGRARRKPLKPFACGNAGMSRWTCGDYARVVYSLSHARLRVHRAPGIPHALILEGEEFELQPGRKPAAGMRRCICDRATHSVVIICESG